MERATDMRPIYESETDLRNERQIIDGLNEAWRTQSSKLPRSYGLDYALTRGGRVTAFVEIKCRTIPSWTYDTYMISLAKVLKAKSLGNNVEVPALLVVRWNDMVGYVDLRPVALDVQMGGRTDRGDAQDIEPVCMIPIKDFTPCMRPLL